MGDGEPKPESDPNDRDEHDEHHDEDRDAIFARRKLLVSAALVGMTLPAEGCDWLQEKFGARSAPCLTAPIPQVCLALPVDRGDVMLQPQACLNVAPQPCLAPPPSVCLSMRPAPCLRVASPRDTDEAQPRPCLSRPAPRTCLSQTRPAQKGDDDKDE